MEFELYGELPFYLCFRWLEVSTWQKRKVFGFSRNLMKFGKVNQSWIASFSTNPEDDLMPKLDGYLRIKEAAVYLGVSPNTLRNWGRSGKIKEYRHPVNNYRLFKEEELDELLDATEQSAKAPRKPR